MTTLPHTAPLRLPRSAGQLTGPNGNGQVTSLAGPNGHAGPVFIGGPGAPGAAQMAPADVWRVIRSHMWLIILSLVVFGAGGYAINQYVLKPHYSKFTSTALCRVSTDSMIKAKVDP